MGKEYDHFLWNHQKKDVQQCYNAFGIRVGLGDNWEDIYDGWNKEMK